MAGEKRIGDYLNHEVEVTMKDGGIVEGILAFYNWDQQIVHVREFKHKSPDESEEGYSIREGKFMVINCREWKDIKVI